MTAIRSKNLFAAAVFAFTLLSISGASAQQITYYDFNTPQAATPAQYSYTCSPTSTSNPLFCFNGTSGDPSFFSDFYPPFIDPNAATDSDAGSTNYAVQLTPASAGQDSSLWFSVPQNVANGFTSWFAFKFTPGEASSTTADGMAFVIQNSPSTGATTDPATNCGQAGYGPTAYGGGGGCIGYSGINNSLALEFDTYDNGTNWDPNANHIALEDCGAGKPNSADHYYPNTNGQTGTCSVNLGGPNSSSVSTLIPQPLTAYLNSETNQQVPVTLADGNIHQVVVVYSGPSEATPNQLQVFLDPQYVSGTHTPVASSIPLFSGTIDITTALNLATQNPTAGSTCTAANPCTNAYIGFTSATGEFFEQHELMAWTFTPHTTVTTTQPLQPAGSPTYQQFNFGTHTYGTQYPSSGPPTTGISMTLTANTITPTAFSTLIAGTPFQGSSCQVYDDTGSNCIIYSVSCSLTSTGAPAACPSVTNIPNCSPAYAAECINVKTVFNSDDSVTPPSPGFLQGDPFYSQIKSLSGSGSLATITCAGECSVTHGQTVSIVGAQPTGFNGSYTVSSITGVNAFTAQSTGSTALPSSATTGGYLTSSNVQNIFTSYSTQNIDGTSTGKTLNFSDFVFTSITNDATSSIQLGAVTSTPVQGQSDLLTATVSGAASQLAAPTGNVIFYAGSTQICSNPVSTTADITTATCSFTPTSANPVSITADYQGDAYHLPILSSGLNLTPTAATPTLSFAPAPASQTYGTPITAASLDATASYNNNNVPGGFAYTTTINGMPNQPVIPGVTVLPAGSYTITAIFTPSDSSSYTGTSTTAAYGVNQATPIVTWPTASVITFGETLASSTLSNGSAKSPTTGATVPGVFAFTVPTTQPPATASQSVSFTPGDVRDYSSVTGSVTVTVTAAPLVTVSPTSINFGTAIYFGSIITKTVTITNTGDAVMNISDPLIAIVQGGNSNEFITVNLCPKSLTVGKSCIMTVTFIAGPFYAQQKATLKITDNAAGSPQTVSLSATVINPVASFSANTLNFGTVKTNSGTATKSITLSNPGGTALAITGFAFAGADPHDFSETKTCTGSLAPKGTCSISITFKPTAKGSRTATLVVTDNAQNSPQSISLTGTGN